MKKVIYSFLFLLIIFILNIFSYFFIKDYQIFIKSLKYWDDYLTQNKDPSEVFFTDEVISSTGSCTCDDKNKENSDNKTSDNKSENIFTWNEKNDSKVVENTIDDDLIKTYSWVISQTLDIFWSGSLLKIKKYSPDYKLFWLTDEYPKKYLTYTNQKFELYMFLEDDYDNLFNVFSFLWNELNFELNKTNTFWNRSFFINNSQKNQINIIVKHSNKLFWIKLDKKYYPEIRKFFKNL